MSEAKPGVLGRRGRRDRWGLPPVRGGWVRGQVRNFRRGYEISEYGDVFVWDFDLFVDDDQPLVAVRMRGTDFQGGPGEGEIVELRDPDPTVRPIETTRLEFPNSPGRDAVSFYPGRDDIPEARQRMNGLVVIVGPIVAAAAAIGVFLAIHG
ncbi:MAG TPA: hypothetical protein VFN46_07690 [Acetobacteraceae bacterium]|nr:hypothetical protein [Acetobacteraceae bacterium]